MIGARAACLASLFPLLLWGPLANGAQRAAVVYLLLVPLTAPPLQHFAATQQQQSLAPRELCRAALWLGNLAALLLPLPLPSATLVAHALVAVALCLGCTQLLIMVHKGNVLRVMACTAAAVVVAALAVASVLAPLALARRFFQSAILPFGLLFLEATRSDKN
jgi:hypothetical protein